MLLSAGTRNFETIQRDNHKSYGHETYHTYVSPWDLSFATKLGCHPKGVTGRGRKNPQKCHQIHEFSTLTSRKSSLKNATKVGFLLPSSLTIWFQSDFSVGGIRVHMCIPPTKDGGGAPTSNVSSKSALVGIGYFQCDSPYIIVVIV